MGHVGLGEETERAGIAGFLAEALPETTSERMAG